MKIRPGRVSAIIVAAIAFIYAAPAIEWIEERMMVAGIVLLILFALFSAFKKAWFDVGIATTLAVYFTAGLLLFSDISQNMFIIRSTAIAAFVGMHLILLIGPLSQWSTAVRNVYEDRRHLGVTTFLLAWWHAATVLRVFFDYDFEIAFASTFIVFGQIALLIMMLLAMSSWDKAQKYITLKNWYIIHTAVLAVYLGLIAYAWPLTVDMETLDSVLLIGFGVYWLAIAPYALPRLSKNRINGWKQLHLLIYVAYISLIAHSWNAYVQYLDGWIPVAYWAVIVITVLAHIAGRVLQVKEWSANRGTVDTLMDRDGIPYAQVANVGDIESGKAVKVTVQGTQVALFNNNGEYFGVTAMCPHQGGPLDKGEIVNGYVECPWHKWQFSASDGQGPPDFPDCVPYYSAFAEGDKIYVSTQPTDRCQLKNGQYKKVG